MVYQRNPSVLVTQAFKVFTARKLKSISVYPSSTFIEAEHNSCKHGERSRGEQGVLRGTAQLLLSSS